MSPASSTTRRATAPLLLLLGASGAALAVGAAPEEALPGAVAPSRAMLDGPGLEAASGSISGGAQSDGAAAYQEVTKLVRFGNGCSCECSYLGGLCKIPNLDACCQEACCGAEASFPIATESATARESGVAPAREMLHGASLVPATAVSISSAAYNKETTLFKSEHGCECECSFLGGLCRTASENSCCQDLCCGGNSEFPIPELSSEIAPSRAMLSGPGLEPAAAVAPSAEEPTVAPSRAMLNGPGLAPAEIASTESGSSAYNQAMSLSRSDGACGECQCSYLGGMCRVVSERACCQELCCGSGAEFPIPSLAGAIAPARAMLVGAGPKPKEAPSTATHTTTQTQTQTQTQTTTETQTTTSTRTTTETTTTLTTTTVTHTTTSTSTTTAYCFDQGSSWSPDMEGEAITSEKDVEACQERCIKTAGCMQFSFFEPLGNCQIHDAFAIRHPGLPGYVSGPKRCWAYMDHSEFSRLGKYAIVPEEFSCIEPGVGLVPSLATEHLEGAREEVVRSCHQRCAKTEGCAFFTVMLPSTCHLLGEHAMRLPGLEMAVSGTAHSNCDPSHLLGEVQPMEQAQAQVLAQAQALAKANMKAQKQAQAQAEVIMKKNSASDPQLASPHDARLGATLSPAELLIGFGVLGAVSALVAAVFVGRRRRRFVRSIGVSVPLRPEEPDVESAAE